MLHVLPLVGLNLEYIDILRRMNGSQHTFVVSSCKSAVIRFCPMLMAIKNLIFLSECYANNEKKRINEYQKELESLVKDSDFVVWHSNGSTNKRFIEHYLSKSDTSKHMLVVPKGEALSLIDNFDKDAIISNFKHICFTRDIDEYIFRNAHSDSNVNIYCIDINNGIGETAVSKAFRSFDEEYQITHSGINVQIGYNYSVKNHYSLYELFSEKCEHDFWPYFIMQSGVFYIAPARLPSKYLSNVRRGMNKLKTHYKMPLYKYSKDKFEIYCDLQSIDCVVLDLKPPIGFDYICFLLELGKQIYFPDDSLYIDYLTNNGFNVYSFSQIMGRSVLEMREKEAKNMQHLWFTAPRAINNSFAEEFCAMLNKAKNNKR